MGNKAISMASPTVKPVLDYVNLHKSGVQVESIAEHVGISTHHAASTARFLAQKRRIAVIRKQGDMAYTYMPMDQVGADYVPALRKSWTVGTTKKSPPGDGKITGAFCLLQIAGKVIEFESMTELRNFIDAWGAQA